MISPQRDVATITTMLNLIESPDIRQRIETVLKQNPTEQSRVLSADEAGKILGVSGRTVFSFAKDGLIRRVKYPGRKIAGGFLLADVVNLLEKSVVEKCRQP